MEEKQEVKKSEPGSVEIIQALEKLGFTVISIKESLTRGALPDKNGHLRYCKAIKLKAIEKSEL